MSDSPGEHTYTPSVQPSGLVDVSKTKQSSQQSRQLLSCTKCRERKVKCDRTKPCSACCARGIPKECHFVAEGGDYAPIQQSYEIRRLRRENMRLKDLVRSSKRYIEDDDSDPGASPQSQLGERTSSKRRVPKQKRFAGSECQGNIYFGSPGLANLVNDFTAANMNPAVNLVHAMPRGSDMYTSRDPPRYPFMTLFKATPEECIPQLIDLLPQEGELMKYLDFFERRVTVCSFPHVPIEITQSEVERFLLDRSNNAYMCPDMLALIFAAIALGAQYSVWDRSGARWDANVMDQQLMNGDIYISAAMQALRLASFMNKPSLLGIQTLLMISPYLTNSGRFLDAWTLFGTTIRLAHSIGLHRNPKHLNPAPPTTKEVSIRQTLWWWMLHMDEQYSMTLGRPLGISGFGDCPWPIELTTDPVMLRFGEFMNRFTVLGRGILGSDRLTDAKIDEFTDELRRLLETMPESLVFREEWSLSETEIPEWPLNVMAAVYYCKTHTYLILLNRQRDEKHKAPSQMQPNWLSSFRTVNRTSPAHPSPTTLAPLRGRALVISSSEGLLSAFLFFYHREPSALIDWTMGQQAFNSCMILLLDAIEHGRVTHSIRRVEMAFVVFKDLCDNKVHKLAGLAVERISWGLQELRRINSEARISGLSPRGQHGGHAGMHEISQNEAPCGTDPTEMVMSNTGPFVLEDSGLQASVVEAYAPMAWNRPSFTKDQHQHQHQQEITQRGGTIFGELSDDFERTRSADVVQGMRRSATMGSAHTRYAKPSEDGTQPHGNTAPTLPASLATPLYSTYETFRSVGERQTPQGFAQEHPTIHQSRLHEATFAPEHISMKGSGFPQVSESVYRRRKNGGGLLPSPDTSQFPPVQARHNSCPTIPHSASDSPLLRTAYSSPGTIDRSLVTHVMRGTPLRTSISASTGSDQASPRAHPNHPPPSSAHISERNLTYHLPFAARAMAPTVLTNIADSRRLSHPPGGVQAIPGLSQEMFEIPQQQQHSAFGMDYTLVATFSNPTPSSLTPLAENMNIHDWKAYSGTSGPG